jgi:hypothetical protein
MSFFSTADENTFQAKLKILHNNNQIKLLEIINNYLKKYHKNDYFILEKMTSNMLVLNFKNNTDTANCVLGYLKIKKLENNDLSNIKCSVNVKIVNPCYKKKYFHKSKLLMLSPSIMDRSENDSINNEKKDLYRNYNSSNNSRLNVIQNLYFLNNTAKNKILNESKNKVNQSVVDKQSKNILEDLFFLNEQNISKLNDEDNNKEVTNNIAIEENNLSRNDNNVEVNNLPNIVKTENNFETRIFISRKKNKNNWLIQAKTNPFEKKTVKILNNINNCLSDTNEILDFSNKNTINKDGI